MRILIITAFLLAAWPAAAARITGTVLRVIDGDTVEVLIGHRPVRVRLASIDAPEISRGRGDPGQPFGQESRQSLKQLVAKRAVTIYEEGTDENGYMFGTIYDGPININARQVSLGMAWVYRRYSRDPVLMWLEYQAKTAKRGLWADPDPVPPWEYRYSR